MTMMTRLLASAALAAAAQGAVALEAAAQDKVIFGTNWKAQAEHGGYYYAVANGIYKEYGLEVEIRQGGPQVSHPQLLAAGRIDFNMGSNMHEAFNFVQNNIPMVTVAAIFQKDPQILMTHPGQGLDTLEKLKGQPILISTGARTTYWQWLKVKYGFTDDQIRPYTFNPGPFIADKRVAQQGYVTSEPFAVEKQGGFKPVVHLLADSGYKTYSTTISTSWRLVNEKPDLVQRFVDATIKGWDGYIYKGSAEARAKADALIKKDNPDMADDQLAFSLKAMIDYGIVKSGDAETLGIGAMTDQRWKDFLADSAAGGLFPADLDLSKAYTLKFVNKKVGM